MKKETSLLQHTGYNFFQNKFWFCLQFFGIVSSLIYLVETDSVFSVYVFTGSIGVFSLTRNFFHKISCSEKTKSVIFIISSVLFSLCILLANYPLWNYNNYFELCFTGFKILLVIFGSIVTSYNTLITLDDIITKGSSKQYSFNEFSVIKLFVICFSLITIIDLCFLYLFAYPGFLTPDSMCQMNQLLNGTYSNHHPFWHTMVIKLFVDIANYFFHDINLSISIFFVFQILFLSFCFSFCVITAYQMNAPKFWIILLILFFSVTPYNIAYSVTMWKDIPFGAAALLFITSLYRILKGIGRHKWVNWATVSVGGLGLCLWRSNGWIAFLILTVLFIILFFRSRKKLCLLFVSVLIITYIMIHPVLSALNVVQPDTIESLSIPSQQIARVVKEHNDLTDSERELLQNIIDVNKIPEKYYPLVSDNIKTLVRETNNQEYISTHKSEFIKLYINLGLRHPKTYIRAWIDQTKGFWNGRYQYWIYSFSVFENNNGIHHYKPVIGETAERNITRLFITVQSDGLFSIFTGIGFCTWATAGCSAICLANRRKREFILSIVPLAVVFTLCIATPVFSEFRYAYSLFTCIPMIITATFFANGSQEKTAVE